MRLDVVGETLEVGAAGGAAAGRQTGGRPQPVEEPGAKGGRVEQAVEIGAAHRPSAETAPVGVHPAAGRGPQAGEGAHAGREARAPMWIS